MNPALSATKNSAIVPNSHFVWMCRARYQSPRRARPIASAENALMARMGRRACRPRSSVATASPASSSASPARLLPDNRSRMSSERFFAVSMILPASSRCFGFCPVRGRNANTLGMLRLPSRRGRPGPQAGSAVDHEEHERSMSTRRRTSTSSRPGFAVTFSTAQCASTNQSHLSIPRDTSVNRSAVSRSPRSLA